MGKRRKNTRGCRCGSYNIWVGRDLQIILFHPPALDRVTFHQSIILAVNTPRVRISKIPLGSLAWCPPTLPKGTLQCCHEKLTGAVLCWQGLAGNPDKSHPKAVHNVSERCLSGKPTVSLSCTSLLHCCWKWVLKNYTKRYLTNVA